MSIRVVFMGSPEFALPTLSSLANSYQVVGVVTQPDRASGRGRELKAPPVKPLALTLHIPVIQPEKLRLPEPMEQLRAWAPDLIVVAAFGQILKKDVLELPKFGCINVHASLLPRWRGAAPINAAILAGDEETGVTIMKMDVGLDTGPTYVKRSIRLKPDDTTGSVLGILSTLGAVLLNENLSDIISGKLKTQPQPAEGATYAPMLKKEDGLLDFTQPAIELERRVRAMNPWPGAWFEWDGNPLKVARASVVCVEKGLASGSRFTVEGRPAVMSADGALVLEEIQPAGKKVMSGRSFLAGAREWTAFA
ncbi:methionyl-tRNA formyltransferase [Candidatus Villigracilis saccharophilus]|uniref:methionyl-tRNA formyltransferase n=1 Tax=Candidatus Villigracilis saccharophilus TaxID=3140684 RepID=UPI003135B54E|nr:methionyl-tRNA formyltransferase [Anaerolineales bacterium]